MPPIGRDRVEEFIERPMMKKSTMWLTSLSTIWLHLALAPHIGVPEKEPRHFFPLLHPTMSLLLTTGSEQMGPELLSIIHIALKKEENVPGNKSRHR
jgi:hypothetical protein